MTTRRQFNDAITWFGQRRCWRFKYRDPETGGRKFINCNQRQYERAGLAVDDPDVLRVKGPDSLELARRLQARVQATLPAVVLPESAVAPAPAESPPPPASAPACAALTVTGAIDAYFALYDHHAPTYGKTLRFIFEQFRDVVGDKPFGDVDDGDIKAYERHLSGRELSRTSVRSYIKQLGMLVNFAVRKGWLAHDPRLTYRLPRECLKAPNPMSDDELSAFFAWAWGTKPHLAWMGVGLLGLGLRPIELEHAQWENVNWDERFLFIERSHPNKMPQACQNQPIPRAVWPLFEQRRADAGPIWVSERGRTCGRYVLDRARRTVQEAVGEAFQWKRFRKTFATVLERAGNDVVVVSRLLRQSAGGKNVTMAQRHYIGKSQAYLLRVVDDAVEGRLIGR